MMSTHRLRPSRAQQSAAALLAGLTTLAVLWGMVGLADGYRADSAQMAQAQPARTLAQHHGLRPAVAPQPEV